MVILEEVRCPRCSRMLGKISGQAQIKCPKCKALIEIDTETDKKYIKPERQK